ncbi:MAG: nuclear transport factor 2 family protein [Acidobacteriota bacterium]|nr:nuclear transport factor 2 family protein [Acidobacteriota bacterium]
MLRMRNPAISLGLLILLSGACATPPGSAGSDNTAPEERQAVTPADGARIEADIRALMEQQAGAWNEGDLVRFVADYLDSPRMRFVSGGSVRYGAGDVLDRYRRTYPDRAAMGLLTFTDLDVRVLSEEYVFVFGRYNLERENDAPTGLFTLLFERTADGWKISHDHTSSG